MSFITSTKIMRKKVGEMEKRGRREKYLPVCVCVCDTEVWGVVCHSGPLLSTAGVSQNPIRSKSHLGGTFIMDPAHSDCCYEYN